jgi:hypothetical protein
LSWCNTCTQNWFNINEWRATSHSSWWNMGREVLRSADQLSSFYEPEGSISPSVPGPNCCCVFAK